MKQSIKQIFLCLLVGLGIILIAPWITISDNSSLGIFRESPAIYFVISGTELLLYLLIWNFYT